MAKNNSSIIVGAAAIGVPGRDPTEKVPSTGQIINRLTQSTTATKPANTAKTTTAAKPSTTSNTPRFPAGHPIPAIPKTETPHQRADGPLPISTAGPPSL